jgi:dihydroorotase-like cyclic amidohydrolase
MAEGTVLRRGVVVTPSGPMLADVVMDGGRIRAIEAPDSIGRGRREFDVEGSVVLPGVIDPHAHLGLGDTIGDETMAEGFSRTTRDCLVGGVTTVATTTLEGREPLRERFDRALRSAEGGSWVDYKITSVVGNLDHVEDIGYVAAKGGVSFKFFTGYVGEQAEEFGQDPAGITPDLFFLACEAIRDAGARGYAAIHAEEPYVRAILAERIRTEPDRGGPLSRWARSSPEWAESAQVFTYAFAAHSAGVPLSVVHVSSALTVDAIGWLHGRGVDVIGETLAFFLATTAEEMDAAEMGAKAKIQPPIRGEVDRSRLWQGVREGIISIVGTDSLTYSSRFKQDADFWSCRVGINPQFADLLPLVWDEGIVRGRLDLSGLARILSENAARRLRLYPRKGAILPGSDADLVVVDPDADLQLGVHRYRGGTDYSLWEGRAIRGVPTMTFLRGELVAHGGEIVADAPSGQHLSYRVPAG